MHVDLVSAYIKSIRQHNLVVTIIQANISLTCMTMIYPTRGWSEFFEVPTFDLNEVTGGSDDCIDKLYTRISYLFNNTSLERYPSPTWSSPRFYLRSHYPVCIKNHLFIVGIRRILNKYLELVY